MIKYIPAFLLILFYSPALSAQKTVTENEIKYTINDITTGIQLINDNTARIFKYQGTAAPVKNSLVVLHNKNEAVETLVQENKNSLIIRSDKLKIELNKTDGAISFYNNNGLRLLAENKAGQQFQPIDDSVTHICQSFNLSTEEAMYGLGQHQNGKMNQRSQTILLKQRNMDVAVPFLQSTKGYGIYWDNYSATIYAADNNTMRLTSEAGNNKTLIIDDKKGGFAGMPQMHLLNIHVVGMTDKKMIRYKGKKITTRF